MWSSYCLLKKMLFAFSKKRIQAVWLHVCKDASMYAYLLVYLLQGHSISSINLTGCSVGPQSCGIRNMLQSRHKVVRSALLA